MKSMLMFLSFGFGGAEGRLIRLCAELNDTVLCFNEKVIQYARSRDDLSGSLDVLVEEDRLIVIPKAPNFIGFTKAGEYIWCLLAGLFCILKYRPRVFHCALGGILLSPFSKLIGGRSLIELTSPDNVDFVNRYKRFLGVSSPLYLAVSPSVRKKAETLLEVEVEEYPVPFYQKRNFNREFNSGEIVNISFCARFISRKNPALFADAMNILLRRRNDFKVVMMGDGDETDVVEETLREYIGSGRVRVGRVLSPYIELLDSDIFVSLIEPDNYPSQSVLEAMDAGNVLVLSDTGDSGRFLDGNGVLVELNASSIADSISAILDSRDSIDIMKSRSSELLDERFSPVLAANKLDSLYKRLFTHAE